jgi:hypothetical protein
MAARRIVGEAFVLKSLVFRSFQIVQLTRMVREAKTFRFEIGTLNMPIHQSMSREEELDKLQHLPTLVSKAKRRRCTSSSNELRE